jgi:hypothetical protein
VAFPSVSLELLRAVKAGLHGAAVLSPAGDALDSIGAIWPQEIRAIAALVSKQGPQDLLDRLFAGELATATLDGTVLDDELRVDPSEPIPNALGLTTAQLEEIHRARRDDRTVFLGIAARCVFVVGIAGPDRAVASEAMERLCADLDRLITLARRDDVGRWQPPPPRSSGSGSPPAEAFVFLPRPRGRGQSN